MPRFTLRDLFWLTLVVALLVVWAVERFRVGELQKSSSSLREENSALFKKLYPDFVNPTPPPKPTRSPYSRFSQ